MTTPIRDTVLERIIRLLGIDLDAARKTAPHLQRLAEAFTAAAETFSQKLKP